MLRVWTSTVEALRHIAVVAKDLESIRVSFALCQFRNIPVAALAIFRAATVDMVNRQELVTRFSATHAPSSVPANNIETTRVVAKRSLVPCIRKRVVRVVRTTAEDAAGKVAVVAQNAEPIREPVSCEPCSDVSSYVAVVSVMLATSVDMVNRQQLGLGLSAALAPTAILKQHIQPNVCSPVALPFSQFFPHCRRAHVVSRPTAIHAVTKPSVALRPRNTERVYRF
jgi:hypothetical protein